LKVFGEVSSKPITIRIVSRRFYRDSDADTDLTYSVTDSDNFNKTYKMNFIKMPNKNIMLQRFVSFFPVAYDSYQSIMTSVNILSSKVSAVRYDIETASSILSMPNSPSSSNVGFITRSLDTRGSQNYAFTMTSI
jgi:hypothetical protein